VLKFENYSKIYGGSPLFENFGLLLEDGVVTAILGASGAGKTTLLNAIANRESGVLSVPPLVSYCWQEDNLVPSLTVFGNLDYALSGVVKDKEERAALIYTALQRAHLFALKNRKPKSLSGGEARRVALTRAFLYPAPLILLDEPFKGLDDALKEELYRYFELLLKRTPVTVILVTHDKAEAERFAARIVELEGKPVRIK
jgi:NitT/TauT family transport system ATP-binding protein